MNFDRLIFILLLIVADSCKSGDRNAHTKVENKYCENKLCNIIVSLDDYALKKEIGFSSNMDTEYVKLTTSGYSVTINYYENKPQYFQIKKDILDNESTTLNFRKENSGVFFSIDSIGKIKELGYKYLDSTSGGDLRIDDKSSVFQAGKWDNYSNNGWIIGLDDLVNQKILVYKIKDSEIVDSFFLIRNKK